MNRPFTRRAGPLFGVVLVVTGMLGAVSPVIPAARALDPSPAPSESAEPSPEVTPAPTAAPTVTPAPPTTSPEPTPSPSPSPAGSPAPSPAPSPVISPSPGPSESADPGSSADPGISPEPSASDDPGASPSAEPSAAPSASASPLPAGPHVEHAWVETLNTHGTVVARGNLDQALDDAQRFTVYEVRFQLVNDADTDATVKPELQVAGADGSWTPVPEVDPVVGAPFYAAADDGKVFQARKAPIDATALRLATSDDANAVAVPGESSAGRNPAAAIDLPAHSFTEVQFAVRATIDAAWRASYQFRLIDGADALPDAGPAVITMESKPVVELSPGQRHGKKTPDALPLYPLAAGGRGTASASATTTTSTGGALVGLRVATGTAATTMSPLAFTSPHMTTSITSDTCAACHTTHAAQGPLLLGESPMASLCFKCHDGSGASSNIQAQFTSAPANLTATSSYYQHPATEASSHTSSGDDEFEGVLNRHAQCADCHQPHASSASRPIETTDGWTAPGAISGAPGVAVANGAAGIAPTYTLQKTSAFEYQLCFKCHSSFTELPAQDPDHPSGWALDKAVELNPANVSYHPIEAEGRNQTSAMALSLSGTSPAKLWSFDTTSTIRCTSCHGNPALANPASPPAADAALDDHASPNRGLLIAPYRDRDLLAANETYAATDFSLCYVCHAEAPMVDDSGDPRYDTNFNWHGFHLNDIGYNGTGNRDIDVAGDGQGNATCSECHFRIHSDVLAVGGQTPAPGLVNFAPDVQPYNGTLSFVPATSTTLGTCTLTCHGKPHNSYVYAAAP
jgi:predicted CXXCH cytochrome family protein